MTVESERHEGMIMHDCKINILGTEYKVLFRDEKNEPKLKEADGYIDSSVKKIVVGIFEKDEMSIEDLASYQKKVLRHEIIHAFLYESGLWDNSGTAEAWGLSEEIADWFALQSPKIFALFKELDII